MKPLEEFPLAKKRGQLHTHCKSCKNAKLRAYMRAQTPEVRKQKMRQHRLQSKYGITTADYDRMCLQQKGLCVICSTKPEQPLVVDHCHISGKVRGLLCGRCNTGLGHFLDEPKSLIQAILYVGGATEFYRAWEDRLNESVMELSLSGFLK